MADPLNAFTLPELRRRASMKWRHYPPDVLPAWVAEMDVAIAEPIARAVREAISLGDTGYPQESTYVRAMVEFAAARWAWSIDPGQVALVPDVMRGIVEVLKLLTGDGDAVVVNSPVYPPFYSFVRHLNRRIVEAPLTAGHRIDPDGLAVAFAAATAGRRRAVYLLCSPHNPTGTVHRRDELIAINELALRYGVRVVVDEIHAPIVFPGATHLPYLTLPGTERAFAVFSASKAWNLAGLKAGVAIAGPAALEELARMPEEVRHGASHLGVLAHASALTEGAEWLDAVLAGLENNRRLLAELLAERLPAIGYLVPEGTYLAWLDCRKLNLSEDPAEVFLARGRLAVNSGSVFGTGGAGHVRLNFATSPELVTEAVRRMADALR